MPGVPGVPGVPGTPTETVHPLHEEHASLGCGNQLVLIDLAGAKKCAKKKGLPPVDSKTP